MKVIFTQIKEDHFQTYTGVDYDGTDAGIVFDSHG